MDFKNNFADNNQKALKTSNAAGATVNSFAKESLEYSQPNNHPSKTYFSRSMSSDLDKDQLNSEKLSTYFKAP